MPIIIGLITALVGLIVQRYWFMRIQSRRTYLQHKALQRPLTVRFTDDAFICESETGAIRMPRRDFLKWKMDDRTILLYITGRMFYMIPRQVIGGQDTLESLIRHLAACPRK